MRFDQGRFEEVGPHYRRCLKLRARAFGECNVKMSNVYNNYGQLCYQYKDYKEALSFTEKALAIYDAVYAGHDKNVPRIHHNLARIHFELGDLS